MAHEVIVPPSGTPLPKMTFEEFLAWVSEDTRAEWVDGEVFIEMSPVTTAHQHLNLFLATLLHLFVVRNQAGEVFTQEFLMRLRSRPSGREPDLIVVTNEHANWIRNSYLDGPGDIVVEIVSPESIERDRETKFAEYEQAGVREYWLIDPLETEAIFYRLEANGRYQPISADANGNVYSTVLPGFFLNVNWLWQEPKPLFEALQALNLGV